ncbi:MAG: peptidoglycan editing factor PgeF [Pseudomonadota bacterium]|nr:peptidoglycan editing factor PgeF [Pseudomonadota bacterium]
MRHGGHSQGAWSSFNLAQHCGDAPADVNANRMLLLNHLRAETGVAVPGVQWLSQVHGTRVFHAGERALPAPQADAAYASDSPLAIAVMTADCLPVLFASNDGREIAVAHAGWRGLLNGVLEATLASFHAAPDAVSAWLGPAIGPCHFEVGAEVRTAFLARAKPADHAATYAAFVAAARDGKWLADLYALARIRLRAAGLVSMHGDALCTVCHSDRFYSYRKQPVTGRFATLILRAG